MLPFYDLNQFYSDLDLLSLNRIFKICQMTLNVGNTVDIICRQYFFPRVILYNFFLFWLIDGGLGFWGWGLTSGFWGWGFQLMWFGAWGMGPSGFFGLRLSI